MNCNNLQIINANSIGTIEDFAFYGCNNIFGFNIKENVAKNIKYGINNDILSTYFVLPEIDTPFNNISWQKINLISKKNKAKEYFKIGDEKELQIGSETHHVQILGFDHDDKSDGTGKAGITVGLKEMMTTNKAMNSTAINVGGWEQSEMRTYLQNDILPILPSDLQSVIKTVDKKSDIGNKNTVALKTTQDKLFLFSFEEVGFTSANSSYFVAGQGTKYKYFTDDTSRTKKYLNNNSGSWWLRSTITNNVFIFHYIIDDNNIFAYCTGGVVFGFAI